MALVGFENNLQDTVTTNKILIQNFPVTHFCFLNTSAEIFFYTWCMESRNYSAVNICYAKKKIWSLSEFNQGQSYH